MAFHKYLIIYCVIISPVGMYFEMDIIVLMKILNYMKLEYWKSEKNHRS